MSNRGRPSVLNEQKKAKLLKILASGCGRQTAAGYLNCNPRTIANTAKRDPVFAEKLAEIEHAEEIALISSINKSGHDSRYWRAAAWSLERRHPEKFAHRTPHTL